MKKLMTIAAVALAAAGAQAASVQWKSYNPTTTKSTFLVDKTGAQIGKADYAALGVNLVLVSLAGDDLASYQAGTYSAAYDAGKVLSTGTISASTKAAGKGSFSTDLEFTYGSANPIKDGDWLAVLITDGTTMQNLTYADAANGKVTDAYLVNGLADNLWVGTGNQPFNFATKGNFTAEVGAIPEPTSAMLLLLGVAGLALRRRRK